MTKRKAARLKDISAAFVKKLGTYKPVNPTLGTDPEFFIADKKGTILAADKFLPDKHSPRQVDGSLKNVLFFDGIQAEINVAHSQCRESIGRFLQLSLREAVEAIGSDNQIVIKPSTRVTKKVIAEAKPEARIFGCEPDFNAYTCGVNTSEIDATTHPYRYAGGHIHIGISSPYITEKHPEFQIAKTEDGHLKAIKFFDYMSGPILMLMDKSPEAKRRRSLYGAAGCFRPTPYGIEYRTPSCWWLKSPASMSLAFGMVKLAYNLLVAGLSEEFKQAVGYTEEEVRAIINESDIVGAKRFWKSLRPYIAVTGAGFTNPLHIKSFVSTTQNYLDSDFKWYENLVNKKPLPFKGGTNKHGTFIHGLAVFEYLIRNGSSLLISDNIISEWLLRNQSAYWSINGWVNQMYRKLAIEPKLRTEIGPDFLKFQESFITNVL